MKKLIIAVIVALIVVPTIGARAEEKEYRSGITKEGPLDIDIWVDNDDGIYYEGESITVFFRADRDCFVAIYSLDTRGNLHILYPINPWDNGFVYGNEVYAVPGDFEDYELIVTGPEGIEHIQAIASTDEMEIPDWYEGASLKSDYYDTPEDFLEFVNDRYFTSRWENRGRAYDHTTVYVKAPRYYYKPVYVPHQWYDYPHYSMIYVDYPFGGEIYIDGIYFGIAPLWIPRVMIGRHWITIYDRYGYCWEDHIDFVHNHTIRLDRSRVKTSRSIVSRFKDVRRQTEKYSRSSYLLSDQKVTTTRLNDAKSIDGRSKRNELLKQTPTRTQTKRIEDSWNRKPAEPGKTDISKKRGEGTSRKSTPDVRPNCSGSKKSGGDSGVAPRPSGNTGDSKKPSGRTTRKSGDSPKSSGTKSSTTKKDGGNISKSSGNNNSGSIGRTSSGQSSSGKSSSSSSRSSKKGGGKK